jgi:hypothetical protein
MAFDLSAEADAAWTACRMQMATVLTYLRGVGRILCDGLWRVAASRKVCTDLQLGTFANGSFPPVHGGRVLLPDPANESPQRRTASIQGMVSVA